MCGGGQLCVCNQEAAMTGRKMCFFIDLNDSSGDRKRLWF